MRIAILALIAACSGAAPRPLNAAATRTITIAGDLVVRGEADGLVSVMAAATLDDTTAYGVVLLPAGSTAASPHVVVARARAWHALSMMVERTDDAASRGVALLPACGRDAVTPGDTLRARLRCYTKQHRLPWSDEVIAFDRARGIIIRREGNAIGVIAAVELDGSQTAGYARVVGVEFEEVASSMYATLAVGRAWQLLSRILRDDVERSFTAARRGIHENSCRVDRWRTAVIRADELRADGDVAAGRNLLRRVLDDTLEGCVRKYERRSHHAKMHGRRAW